MEDIKPYSNLLRQEGSQGYKTSNLETQQEDIPFQQNDRPRDSQRDGAGFIFATMNSFCDKDLSLYKDPPKADLGKIMPGYAIRWKATEHRRRP